MPSRLTGSWKFASFLILVTAALFAQNAAPKYPDFPSETPDVLHPVTDSFNYTRRDVMIPMRDGVKLHTVILIPKGAKNVGILLTRTPYNASDQAAHEASSHLGPSLWGYDNATPSSDTRNDSARTRQPRRRPVAPPGAP